MLDDIKADREEQGGPRGSRRAVLGGTLAAVGVAGAWPRVAGIAAANAQGAPAAKAPAPFEYSGKDQRLTLLGDRPLVAETPESLLDDDTTPIGRFFIRNNGQIPDEVKEPDAW